MSDPTTAPQPVPQPARRLTRSRQDKMVAGVCGGLAHYAGIDPVLVRILFVAGTVLGFGSLALVYLVAWMIVPEA